MRTFLFSLLVLGGVAAIGTYLLFAGQISICDSAPQRPSGVPEQAMWIGGADGGVFVVLARANDDPPTYVRGCVLLDSSGQILYRGLFRFDPPSKALSDLSEPNAFDAWDGEALLLTNGGRLIATDTEYLDDGEEGEHAASCDLEALTADSFNEPGQ